MLQNLNNSTSRSSPSSQNVLSAPQDLRMRRIRAHNSAFQSRIGSLPPAVDVLHLAGFEDVKVRASTGQPRGWVVAWLSSSVSCMASEKVLSLCKLYVTE